MTEEEVMVYIPVRDENNPADGMRASSLRQLAAVIIERAKRAHDTSDMDVLHILIALRSGYPLALRYRQHGNFAIYFMRKVRVPQAGGAALAR